MSAEAVSTISTEIGELYDFDNEKFDGKNLKELYKALTGSNSATYKDVKEYAKSPKTSANFRANNSSGKNVTVTFGKMEWVATYLTTADPDRKDPSGSDEEQPVVLTLLLNEPLSIKEKYSETASETIGTYPSISYGSSYVRASLLSASGTQDYANTINATSLTAITSPTQVGLEFKEFLKEGSNLKSVLLTPAEVGYQRYLQSHNNVVLQENKGYDAPNDAYGDVNNITSYFASDNFNFYNNTKVDTETYVRWKDDLIWLPAAAEVGLADGDGKNGIWNTNAELRNYTTQTGNVWLRNGRENNARAGYIMNKSGATGILYGQTIHVVSNSHFIRPAIHLNITSGNGNSGLDKPTADGSTFTYTGTEQTYSPNFFDEDTMTISGNKQTAAGTYEVTVALKDDLKWKDGSSDPVKFSFVIGKAKPVVEAQLKTPITTTPYVSAGLPVLVNGATGGTPGTFNWGAQSAQAGTNNYTWHFTPDDSDNFEEVSGTMELTYLALTITEISVTNFNKPANGVFTSATVDELKSWLTVTATYSDGSSAPLTSYNLSIAGGKLVAGDNKLTITTTDGSKFCQYTVSDVKSVEVDNILSLDLSSYSFKYPVTADDIKGKITNILASYTNGSTGTLTDYANVTITGDLSAGNGKSVSVGIKDTQIAYAVTIDIAKGDYDVSGITFTGDMVTYDGSTHKIEYVGTLPDGVSVEYAYNGTKQSDVFEFTDAGSYDITLSFTHSNSNYNAIATTLNATLKIEKADVDMSGVSFVGKTVHNDGNEYTLTVSGTLPATPAVTVTYSVAGQSGVSFTDTGVYVFTAKFTHGDKNYNDVADMTATLTISDKPVYDESGLAFSATGAQGGGTAFTATYSANSAITITLEGTLKDKDGAEVAPTFTYKYQKEDGTVITAADLKNAGSYIITVSISTGDTGYAEISDRTATLTISKADVDMSGVTFTDLSVVYDGQPHNLEISGTLPDGVSVEYEVKNQSGADFTEVGEYEFVAKFTVADTDNYNDIADMTATLTITEATVTGITATVADGFKPNVLNTLDDVKKFVNVTVNYTGNGSETAKDFTLSATLRDGGLLEVGEQEVTVTFTDADGTEYKTTFKITVGKAKVALPVYSGTRSYTGETVIPEATDFNGFDSAVMTFVKSKLPNALKAGTYKAVFALNDTDRYEWVTATTLKKSLYAATLYDDEEAVTLEAGEAAVEWTVAKAKISATKAQGKLPVFTSEGVKVPLSDIVGLKFYTDETCAEEIPAEELAASSSYFVKAALLDSENFELDETAITLMNEPFEYTTPEKQLTAWEKVVVFLKANWLWIVIAVVALILLITIIALAVRASKKKREREERRLAEEKEERKREQEERRLEREERMARLSQQQAAPQMPTMMQMPQMMPQMPMSQPMVQQGGMAMGGGVSEAQFMQMQAELATLKAESTMRAEAAIRAEQQIAQTKNDLQIASILARLGGEQVVQGGISIDKLTELIRTEVNNAFEIREKSTAQPAQQTESAPASTQVPPDAVMTTVTTTKIDTTKKPVQNTNDRAPVGRPIVRNYVAPMPVDDGRVFDVGGFYKPADPITDLGLTDDEDKKD